MCRAAGAPPGDPERAEAEAPQIIDADTQLDVYSEKSPMGSALMGHRPGDTVTYDAPNGKKIEVQIVAAKPYQA